MVMRQAWSANLAPTHAPENGAIRTNTPDAH
jgi:hypothetical protein